MESRNAKRVERASTCRPSRRLGKKCWSQLHLCLFSVADACIYTTQNKAQQHSARESQRVRKRGQLPIRVSWAPTFVLFISTHSHQVVYHECMLNCMLNVECLLFLKSIGCVYVCLVLFLVLLLPTIVNFNIHTPSLSLAYEVSTSLAGHLACPHSSCHTVQPISSFLYTLHIISHRSRYLSSAAVQAARRSDISLLDSLAYERRSDNISIATTIGRDTD